MCGVGSDRMSIYIIEKISYKAHPCGTPLLRWSGVPRLAPGRIVAAQSSKKACEVCREL